MWHNHTLLRDTTSLVSPTLYVNLWPETDIHSFNLDSFQFRIRFHHNYKQNQKKKKISACFTKTVSKQSLNSRRDPQIAFSESIRAKI